MQQDLRARARECLKSAVDLIGTESETSIRHGCLELRLCIEYLLLDRFRHYQEYIDDDAMKKWTPKQVIAELLENDPYADQNATIAVGLEKDYGVPSTDMHILGEDKRFRLKWANTNWNALGSFLHAPSLEKLSSGNVPSLHDMRNKAADIAQHLDAMFKTSVWSVTGGVTYLLECQDCGHTTKRYKASIKEEVGFVCRNPTCGAIYDVIDEAPTFRMRKKSFTCPKCEKEALFRAHYIGEGNTLVCDGCDTRWRLRAGLFAQALPSEPAAT
jgi:hypothetical protein